MDNLESRTKQRLLRDKQRCRSYRTPDIPQLLHETDETTWHSPIEISRSAPQFRDTLHRKQMRLQDRERSSRTRRHIHNPQPLCPPRSGTKEKMHRQNAPFTLTKNISPVDYRPAACFNINFAGSRIGAGEIYIEGISKI